MFSVSPASGRPSRLTQLLNVIEMTGLVLLGTTALADVITFLVFPPLSTHFWWAVALNVACTLVVAGGFPLWGWFRRRLD
jgi:hypothetical protein